MCRLLGGCVVMFATLVVAETMWADREPRYRWPGERRSGTGQRDVCANRHDTCFSTGQCCEGFVCAAYDDGGDINYAQPGICVREKEYLPCRIHKECPIGTKCVNVGKMGLKYCVPLPQRSLAALKTMQALSARGKGGLGSSCETDDDCDSFTRDGQDKLCCQKVQRGRLGRKRMCDRINIASVCIADRKRK